MIVTSTVSVQGRKRKEREQKKEDKREEKNVRMCDVFL